ncbi:predicted protein [Plenodomus lingam JN3]|uniref:Predicted protein n=1 Tax=Leptosphaeria maculans (strain JN3 / isolate v23.1.3 / race Av1-4-5-6-7-8) TaxID=985895 RepID=E4ZRC3_LEPMJ|nr:predicted protein [Plenodomus lingam JN3]CBX93788.1 predicted protein [Plenodomus lingam JN3]
MLPLYDVEIAVPFGKTGKSVEYAFSTSMAERSVGVINRGAGALRGLASDLLSDPIKEVPSKKMGKGLGKTTVVFTIFVVPGREGQLGFR